MGGNDVSPVVSLRLASAGAWWALRGRGLLDGPAPSFDPAPYGRSRVNPSTGLVRGRGLGPDHAPRGRSRGDNDSGLSGGRGLDRDHAPRGRSCENPGSGLAGGRGLSGGRGWGRLLALLEAVVGGASRVLNFQHQARLSLGIRAQMVTSLLQEGSPAPAILDALDWLFPEGEEPRLSHAFGVPRGRPLVFLSEQNFREQVLGILGTGRGLRPFLEDYGFRFRRCLTLLFLEFLRRVESALPPPDMEQLERVCRSHAPPGLRPNPRPILRWYLTEIGHAPPEPVPRPFPVSPVPVRHRPLRRRLRPLRFSPYGKQRSPAPSLA